MTIKLSDRKLINFIFEIAEAFDWKFLSFDTLYESRNGGFYAYYLLHINFNNPRKAVKP